MRTIIQRVKSAKVEVDGKIISNIGPGLLCFVGLKKSDTMLDAEFTSLSLLRCQWKVRRIDMTAVVAGKYSTRISGRFKTGLRGSLAYVAPADDRNNVRLRSMPRQARNMGYEILMVSQFTLYGRANGRRLDFSQAMPYREARTMYTELVDLMKKSYFAYRVMDGEFGATMNVSLENDGPVTIVMDSTKTSKHVPADHEQSEEEIPDEIIDAIR